MYLKLVNVSILNHSKMYYNSFYFLGNCRSSYGSFGSNLTQNCFFVFVLGLLLVIQINLLLICTIALRTTINAEGEKPKTVGVRFFIGIPQRKPLGPCYLLFL